MTVCAPAVTDLIVHTWVDQASEEDFSQRRDMLRYPLVRAAEIQQPDGPVRGISRDVSPRGLGLAHLGRIPLGPTKVDLRLGKACLTVDFSVRWCRPCGEDWWVSGGRFLSLSSWQISRLLWATVPREVERRYHRRYPFFRPLTMTTEYGAPIPVFSVDVSEHGLGLMMMSTPLEPQPISLATECEGHPVTLAGRIVSVRPLLETMQLVGVELERPS